MVDPVPPLNKCPHVTAPPSSPPGAPSTVARPADQATQRRLASDHSMTQQTLRPRIDVQETPTSTTWRSSKSKIAITPRSVMTRRSQKQKRVSPPSASPALDSKDSVGYVDEAMLATMSRSRSFVRWRSSASTEQSKNGLAYTPIEIDPTSTTPATRSTSSIPDTRTSSTTSDPTTITGTPHADEPHEASDDSDGSISVSSGGHATMNKLFSTTAYKALPFVRSSWAKWIHEYCDRATHAPGLFASQSSCRLGLVTVGELYLGLLFPYYYRPKHYLFTVPEPRARPLSSPDGLHDC